MLFLLWLWPLHRFWLFNPWQWVLALYWNVCETVDGYTPGGGWVRAQIIGKKDRQIRRADYDRFR
jgi:hypothetical protein